MKGAVVVKSGMKGVVVVAVAFLAVSSEAWAAKRGSSKQQVAGVVNLNTATPQQLDLLPGVGMKAALRVVEYRAKAPFGRPEELVKVKGFGKKRFEKLKAHLTVSGPTTLRVVHGVVATPEEPQVQLQGRAPPKKYRGSGLGEGDERLRG